VKNFSIKWGLVVVNRIIKTLNFNCKKIENKVVSAYVYFYLQLAQVHPSFVVHKYDPRTSMGELVWEVWRSPCERYPKADNT